MRKWLSLVVLLVLVMIPFGCSNEGDVKGAGESPSVKEQNVELMISAAASLTDALTDMKASFEKEHENIKLTFIFGSSGKLVQQIENGAPSDMFLSASKKDMDTLQEGKLLVEETRVDFTANELVLIANRDSTLTIDSFEAIDPAAIDHFAIGEPESVPVGRYTKEVLEHIGLWEPLAGKMVQGSDVRQVLTHVEMGNADVGIVYSSDAKISDKVKVLATANAEWHEPIVYPGAVISESKHVDEAKAFMAFLTSDAGKEILKRYGFK
ncbi:molybdate ABC transporter substrate-binding protein [Sporosarcina sp. FSL K6-1522]|uniref:molybdate ABC transporter substrate-binding protein n=1 Tax=Sporosarcina sp. FSL K6-1522 TaxID=2921554 RepID=UPI003159D8B3